LNLLAFDTSTEVLSIALGWNAGGEDKRLTYEGAGGAAASSSLLPAMAELLAQAGLEMRELDAIVFGAGPGSFTGLRTACSVAQGLAFGAGLQVLGVGTLVAVAEAARLARGATRVVAALDARMGEVYVAAYEHDGSLWREVRRPLLAQPEQVEVGEGWLLAGNAHLAYAGRVQGSEAALSCVPAATSLLALAPALISAGELKHPRDALPLYIRDKVAQTTQEREAQRAAGSP